MLNLKDLEFFQDLSEDESSKITGGSLYEIDMRCLRGEPGFEWGTNLCRLRFSEIGTERWLKKET